MYFLKFLHGTLVFFGSSNCRSCLLYKKDLTFLFCVQRIIKNGIWNYCYVCVLRYINAPELLLALFLMCCSSIGLAKAALESINGENLFGAQGASWSVIYVDIDAHNRNRTIFDTILPRESNSKVAETNSVACIGLICLLSQRCVCSCCYDLTTGSLLSLI